MSVKKPELRTKKISATRTFIIVFTGELDTGEVLTGSPVMSDCLSVAELVFTNVLVNTDPVVIQNGKLTVPIGHAVMGQVAGGVVNRIYDMKAICSTDSTPAQDLVGAVKLRVIPDC